MDADGALKEVVTTSSVSLFCSCVCRLFAAPRFQRHHHRLNFGDSDAW